ncbi:MBL fold metallo-hydrolase [uncultured Croceitalea sp.]|uniref:MBL fold metallo-hydrolase n=1 Tax=uncultured Croceitalea sp. TaxID=1798908 RepID=UPI0033062062
MKTKSLIYLSGLIATIVLACDTEETKTDLEPYTKDSNIEQNTSIVGLSESLHPSRGFASFKQHENDRSFHSDIAFYETVLSYGSIEDPNPVFLLANAYIATNQQNYGIPYFETLLGRYRNKMSDQVRSNYLSAYALLRASYADNISFVSRIGWVKDTFKILEEASELSQKNPLAHWASGIIYAQVPTLFNKTEEAFEELTWLINHPELEPTPGFYREVYHYLAKLHAEEGNIELAKDYLARSGYGDYEPKMLFSGWFSTTKEKGLLFAPTPWVEEVIPNRVFAVRGFGFSDLHFVVSKNGEELISIDAGTQPYSYKDGYEFLLENYPDLPSLTTALITHAHWDHIGGYTHLKSLDSDITLYGRENFHGTVDRILKNHSYDQFRGTDFKDRWVSEYEPDVVVDTITKLNIGQSQIKLIPVTGGETEDALLIHFPELELVFMGDVLMPFYGEPWTEEGYIDEALEVMDITLDLSPEYILHGHIGITILYENIQQLGAYRDAYEWLINETKKHLKNGYSAKDIIRLNLIPPGLQDHPEIFIGYLSPRDHIIARTADHMVGIWQEEVSGKDPEGLDVITSVERGRLLQLYLGLSGNQVAKALKKMLHNGDNELALQMATAAESRYPTNEKIKRLKEEAADRLRSSVQFFDPFKFVTYTEIIGKEHLPISNE